MGSRLDLVSQDGFKLSAYRAEPDSLPKGGLVVLQEIFGVNHHIRSVVDRFAAEGYLALAPAVFDRIKPDIELGYDPAGMEQGSTFARKLDQKSTLADIAAAIEAASKAGRVGVLGYCWGGSYAYLAACRLGGLAAAVGYYGGNIAAWRNEKPQVPTMLHFGSQDTHIKTSDVDAIKVAHPEIPIHVFDAGHGFNCDERSSYDKESAAIARQLTLQFLAKHLWHPEIPAQEVQAAPD